MNHILSLQGLLLANGGSTDGVMGNSSQSNDCGNGNSGISVACPGK